MQDNKSERPSYFSITPANVRYDKSLPPSARLLYGELAEQANDAGYCGESNRYFAELYDVTPQAISKWVNMLAKKKYVRLEYVREGREIKGRLIHMMYQQIPNR